MYKVEEIIGTYPPNIGILVCIKISWWLFGEAIKICKNTRS